MLLHQEGCFISQLVIVLVLPEKVIIVISKTHTQLKTLQAAHERELAACHETVRIMQQRLADREDHLQQQHQTKEKRRPNHNVDYYALKAKVSQGGGSKVTSASESTTSRSK